MSRRPDKGRLFDRRVLAWLLGLTLAIMALPMIYLFVVRPLLGLDP